MKLLLDEMWSPVISQRLRRRGHDVESVASLSDLRARDDFTIFNAAQAEEQTIVTEDVAGFRALAADHLARGRSHAGLIFTHSSAFPRGRQGHIGHLVTALDALMTADADLTNREVWLA